MDGLSLLQRAANAGLIVEICGERLVVSGPLRLRELAQQLLAHKDDVVAAIRGNGDSEPQSWPDDARETFEERLAIATDLGMDTGPGSEAEAIARREARRVAAGFPDGASSRRNGDLIDAALAAFEPMGGLRLVELTQRSPSAPWRTSKS